MSVDDVVIVTGAGGNLGAAVVEILAGRGARAGRHGSNGGRRSTGSLVGLAEPERHLRATGVDLTIPPPAPIWPTRRLQRFGRIDGLVNTVGTFAMADIDAADPAQWEFLFKANLFTTLNMCRAAVPAMRAAGRGSIVNIGAAAAARAARHVRLRRVQECRAAPHREPRRRA